MEIITRQDAIRLRLSRYFTGQPCKSGHTTYRYTQSSVCFECLHPKFESVEAVARREARAAKLQAREDHKQRKAAKALMLRKRFRVYDGDLELFQAAVHASALQREPLLQLSDVLTKAKPENYRGLSVHTFLVHPEDLAGLRSLESIFERSKIIA